MRFCNSGFGFRRRPFMGSRAIDANGNLHFGSVRPFDLHFRVVVRLGLIRTIAARPGDFFFADRAIAKFRPHLSCPI